MEQALYNAVYDALEGNIMYNNREVEIYDMLLPEDYEYTGDQPVIVIGGMMSAPYDGMGFESMIIDFDVNVYNKDSGRGVIYDILNQVRDILHDGDISITDAVLATLYMEVSPPDRVESDQRTRHGINTYQAQLFNTTGEENGRN